MYVYTYIRVYTYVVHGVLKPTKANTWLNYVEFSKPCQAGQLHAQWPHRPHGARGAGAWQSTHGPWAHEPRAPWASLRRSLQPVGVLIGFPEPISTQKRGGRWRVFEDFWNLETQDYDDFWRFWRQWLRVQGVKTMVQPWFHRSIFWNEPNDWRFRLKGKKEKSRVIWVSWVWNKVNFPKQCPHWGICILTAQARTKSAPRGCPDLGARHFSCKLSHKIALVRCPCAFRLRRLPQSLRRGLLVCGLFIVNSLGSGDPAKFLSKMSLHDLAQLLNRRSCGDPGEILSKRSLHEDLVDAMS